MHNVQTVSVTTSRGSIDEWDNVDDVRIIDGVVVITRPLMTVTYPLTSVTRIVTEAT